MYVGDLCLSLIIILILILTSTNAMRLTRDSTTTNTLIRDNKSMNESLSLVNTSSKNPLVQGKEMINDAFANMDRGTIIRGTIVLSGITGLILLYVGIKAFLLRGKRQPKRYTLITDPSSMQEPLFGAHDDEEEIEDDTLFARK